MTEQGCSRFSAVVLFLFVTHAAPVIYCLLKGVIYMKCQRKLIGSCALSFGAGVLLSIFLPPVVMVCITSVVVVGAGVAMVFT